MEEERKELEKNIRKRIGKNDAKRKSDDFSRDKRYNVSMIKNSKQVTEE